MDGFFQQGKKNTFWDAFWLFNFISFRRIFRERERERESSFHFISQKFVNGDGDANGNANCAGLSPFRSVVRALVL